MDKEIVEFQVIFQGSVQGVGFRATLRRYALHFNLFGSVRNLPDGNVELFIQGPKETLQKMIDAVKENPRGATIHSVSIKESAPSTIFNNFIISH